MAAQSEITGRQTIIVAVPNPRWRYARDPANGRYSDSKSIVDGKGGSVIAYALDENAVSKDL